MSPDTVAPDGVRARASRRGASRVLRPIALVPLLLVVLLGLAGVLFYFGGPQRPATADASGVAPATAPADSLAPVDPAGAPGAPPAQDATAPADEATGDEPGSLPSGMMSGGEAPEGGVSMPLIPIPGCKCHSDDPAVVEEHSTYRLSDCAECH